MARGVGEEDVAARDEHRRVLGGGLEERDFMDVEDNSAPGEVEVGWRPGDGEREATYC